MRLHLYNRSDVGCTLDPGLYNESVVLLARKSRVVTHTLPLKEEAWLKLFWLFVL